MTGVEHKPRAFDLRLQRDRVVIAKREVNGAEGIINGILVDVLAFPLFAVALVLGIWLVLAPLTEGGGFHFAPQFDHFASPGIVHAAEAALPVLMGLMFVGGSICLTRLFWGGQPSFFPYECRFRKGADSSWTVQRKLWFLTFPWKKLDRDSMIWCYPWWRKGDWGYVLFMRTKRARFFLARSPAIADSKSEAEKAAQNDLATLKALLDVPGELKGWSFDVQHKRNIGLAVVTLSVLAIAVCCWLVARYAHK